MAASGQMTDPYGPQPGQIGAPMGPEPGLYGPEQMLPPEKAVTSGGIVAAIGGILMILVIMLPWMSVGIGGISTSFNVFDINDLGKIEPMLYAIIVLLMGIVVLVTVALKRPLIAGICGLIGFILMILAMYRLGTGLGDIPFDIGIVGFGVYLGFVGSLLAMVGGFVGHKQMW